jgi:uncharacterized protein GlcG (DUF336 family)
MKLRHAILNVSIVCALGGCGGGSPAVTSTGTSPSGDNCSGTCASASTFLTPADVQSVIAQAVAEAKARGINATIAVVDRVGNVLAVYRMGDKATRSVLIATSVDASGKATLSSGLEGIKLPDPNLPGNIDDQAAIAKAITGAYLSSEGNAFTSRTASQIVQEHFNVGDSHTASGPLFGVQFSQLACSDFISPNNVATPTPGPHNSPLGLSADPGGFPLYKSGTVVGGVGVIADGLYSLDKDIAAPDSNYDDEAIALAGTYSFAAPVDRRADRITAGGVTLRFSDVDFSQLRTDPASAPAFSSLTASTGGLVAVTGYSDGLVHTGTAFDQPASGIRADASGDFTAQNGYIFVDGANNPLHPPMPGTDGANALTQAEVRQILQSALGIANKARAQIRRPDGAPAQVTISVVDTNGAILGMVRTPDAPMFGADVSLQKARSATFMSSASAAAYLQALPPANYIVFPLNNPAVPVTVTPVSLGGYASAAQTFFGIPSLLADGGVAFTDRAIGNLARPFYPDGIDGEPNGPFSKPAGQWSVFSTGLQLDLSINAILQHVLSVATAGGVADVGNNCVGVGSTANLVFTQTLPGDKRLANGLQIFPGGSPIYRNGVLVGGVGVSGDGVDQDDMIGFLGLAQASQALNGSVTEAPAAIRSDQFSPQGTRLRYVQCPQAPFIDSNQENVCASY